MITWFYFFGGLALCIGAALLIRGLRGRKVNDHPICRGCGFDLIGLDLTSTTNCPECGRQISSSNATIRHGLRKRRKVSIVCGVLLLMLGTAGVSWSPISKIPAIQSFNIYEHLPESLLISMATKDSSDAMDVLHSRLIPGEVSEDGLESMIEHALSLVEGESVVWDERWGDVLLYGLLTGQFSDDDQAQYLESLSLPVMYLHPQVDQSAEIIHSELVLYRNSRGTASAKLHDDLLAQSPALYDQLNALAFKATVTPIAESNGVELQPYGWTSGGHGGWTPIGSSQFIARASFRPSDDQRQIQVRYVVSIQIHLNGKVLHEWEVRAESELIRVNDGAEYASIPSEDHDVEKLAKSLELGPVIIPYSPMDALAIEDLHSYRIGLGAIQTHYTTSISLVGTLSFIDGDTEIPYLSMASVPRHDSRVQGINTTHILGWAYRIESPGLVEYGLSEFVRDKEFWKKARLRGAVDVVFRPAPELLVMYPRIRMYLDKPVIFRDVKLEYQQIYQDSTTKRWGWTRSGGLNQAVYGELYKPEESD